ncbi:MAG: DsbA family protein [Patescibacteria group bacterium]
MANLKSVSKFLQEYGTPSAIIAGAFVLSLSVMTSANIVVKNFNPSDAAVRGAVQNAQQAGSQAANTQANPSGPINVTPRVSAMAQGSASAKVTITEFSDFQCPFCEQFFSGSYKQLKAKYVDTGKVRMVFRHLPLASIHPYAQKAAEAAECAGNQGKFWQYHDLLFESAKTSSTALAVDSLKTYAKKLGLNQNQFNTCLDSGATAAVINQDKTDAAKAGISGTPTFVINGQKIVGAQSMAAFENIIEQELKK